MAKRKKRIRARRNFFSTLLVVILSWILVGAIVYFVDPLAIGAVPLLFISLFVSFIFTFSALFSNSTRGIIAAFCFLLFLVLRYFGVGNFINLFLIFGLGAAVYYYFTKS